MLSSLTLRDRDQRLISKAVHLIGAIALVLLIGNMFQVRRYEYISLEGLTNVEVKSTQAILLENLYLGPTVPTEYALSRAEYEVRMRLDPGAIYPHVSVAVLGTSEGTWLRPTAWTPAPAADGLPIRQPRCASVGSPRRWPFDNGRPWPTEFTFLWTLCGDDVSSQEFVIAFDVINGSGPIAQERIPFELKRRGFFVYQDWFAGGVLQWGAPISHGKRSVRVDGGVWWLLRLFLGTDVAMLNSRAQPDPLLRGNVALNLWRPGEKKGVRAIDSSRGALA